MILGFIQTSAFSFLFFKFLTADTSHFILKRSPLELGFVTFPAAEKAKKPISFNRTNAEMSLEKHHQRTRIFDHEWIPGMVKHHAYIPAHIHHVYLPIVLARTVAFNSDGDLYPRTYGGYGVGSFAGGQGAGHGFQILFNGMFIN